MAPFLTRDETKSSWQSHFFCRKTLLKTTWKLRLAVLLVLPFLGFVTRGFWTLWVGQSLICREQTPPSDALLLENFDPDYLVFEHAAALHKAGLAPRIFVPVSASFDFARPDTLPKNIAEVMTHLAWMPEPEFIPIQEIEPISLNAAHQIRDYLAAEHLKSVIVVSPGFRSQRSFLIYAVLSPAGIAVS